MVATAISNVCVGELTLSVCVENQELGIIECAGSLKSAQAKEDE